MYWAWWWVGDDYDGWWDDDNNDWWGFVGGDGVAFGVRCWVWVGVGWRGVGVVRGE